MADQWMIRGVEYSNCNYGCPCQFAAPTTNGFCEAVASGHIEEGNFNDVRLDGLDWALLLQWPGEIAEGNGKQQAVIDERADSEQREALRKILHGESTTPGATHFFVFNSTMSEVLETLYAPIELEIDVEARKGPSECLAWWNQRGFLSSTPSWVKNTGRGSISRTDSSTRSPRWDPERQKPPALSS